MLVKAPRRSGGGDVDGGFRSERRGDRGERFDDRASVLCRRRSKGIRMKRVLPRFRFRAAVPGNGIKALIDGLTDVAMSSRDIKTSETDLAKSRGVTPYRIPVMVDKIALVVNNANPVKNVTLATLKAIYEGKIRNWKDGRKERADRGGEPRLVVRHV